MKKIKLEKVKDLYLLCNYDNGAVVMLEESNVDMVNKFIDTCDTTLIPEEMYSYLMDNNFFVNENILAGQAYVHVTNRCNMNCKGCYSAIDNRNDFMDLTLDEMKRILDELKQHGITQIILSGGEPTIRTDLEQIVKYANIECGFTIVMITNGSILIPDDILKYLQTIAISIDKFDSDRNTLERRINKDMILNNLKNCKDMDVQVGGIITLNNDNIDDVEEYFKLSSEYEIPISFSIFYSNDPDCHQLIIKDNKLTDFIHKCCGSMNQLVEGFSALDEIYCKECCDAGKGNISIDAEGYLTPCHMMPTYRLGNILKESKEAWSELESFYDCLKIEDEDCLMCDYKVLCGGGCKARSYAANSLNAKDPYCQMFKEYYDIQYRMINEIITV